jgi:hypothetical protein
MHEPVQDMGEKHAPPDGMNATPRIALVVGAPVCVHYDYHRSDHLCIQHTSTSAYTTASAYTSNYGAKPGGLSPRSLPLPYSAAAAEEKVWRQPSAVQRQNRAIPVHLRHERTNAPSVLRDHA